MAIVQVIENVDNTNTLYEDILIPKYNTNADEMLVNTKFLRSNILKMIKDFVESEDIMCIKEFSTAPTMVYATDPSFNYEGSEKITTDLVIVPNAFSRIKVQDALDNRQVPYPLVVEALSRTNISSLQWDSYLEDLIDVYSTDEVRKVIIEDVVALLKLWDDTSADTKDMIKDYNATFDVSFNVDTYYQEPLYLVSKKYWEDLSFILTINDYDIYDTDTKYLDIISEKYFNNGYFDEVVIVINYFYWYDDFAKIVEWSKVNLKSALVSYRFNTIFSNTEKNRYYSEEEAIKYGDTLRQNTVEEELEMFETRLPILLEKVLTNPQTFGFELKDGYFGKEGDAINIEHGTDAYNNYEEIMCKTIEMNPFVKSNDSIVRVFNNNGERQLMYCIKK